MQYYSVILRSCPHALTYASKEEIREGSLVSVPFRKGSQRAIVRTKIPSDEGFSAKNIEKVLKEVILDKQQLGMISKISEYYFCSINQASKLYLPTFLWNEKRPRRDEFLRIRRTARAEGAEGAARAEGYNVSQLKRSPKQKKLVELLQADGEMEISEVKKMFSASIITGLLNKKIIQKREGKICPGFKISYSGLKAVKKLTEDQQKIFDNIVSSKNQKHLIHGVTGSGKTEIYLQLIKKTLEEKKGAIILVPEIALTTQLIQYFANHFKNEIAVLHSKMTNNERAQEWWRLKTGEAKVLLGSRSGLFAPVQNLGLVVMDEEHEWTYKQDNAPRYHARKVAEMMMEMRPDVKLVLGSATPSVETYFLTGAGGKGSGAGRAEGAGGYELQKLSERVGGSSKTELPLVEIVDLRFEFRKKNYSIFSDALQEALTETLKNKEQAILFLNRRGAASAVVCRECGYTVKCETCEIAMTLHGRAGEAGGDLLICHHCGSLKKPILTCPNCKSTYIRNMGVGTQRVESEIKKMFPQAKVLRADRDTTNTKKGFEKIYNDFKNHKADILVGTQMIAKGLDIPKVSLVGVMLADIGLHIPDFRASEKTFQLMTQVAGRAGRRDKRGYVIIQTYSPTHPAIVAAGNHDYRKFYEVEIADRKDFGYPPFAPIIKLTFQDPVRKFVFE